MSSGIQILILDLDGTLARTENLSQSDRVPYSILKNSPPNFNSSPFLYRQEFKYELSMLIEQGIPVIVITNSSQSYASTLLSLLGIDFSECYPNSDILPTTGSKIEFIAEAYETLPEQILYVANRVEDREEALIAGCQFEYPYWVGQSLIQNQIMHFESLYTKLIEYHIENVGILEIFDKGIEIQKIGEALENGALYFNRNNLLLEAQNRTYEGPQIFAYPLLDELSFQPVINPQLISRWDYENEQYMLEIFYELIRQLFRPKKLVPGPNNARKEHLKGIEIRTFTTYIGAYLGDQLWLQCKDWRGKSIGSGQEIRLHLIEIVALVMSAFLAQEAILIPAPSSKLSPSKPGEISRRLAARIAQIRRTNVLDILYKTEDQKIEIEPTEFIKSGKLYCLLDDQLTGGATIESCLEKFPIEVQKNMSLIVWSYSATGGRWVETEVSD